jgi:hypothetical protein
MQANLEVGGWAWYHHSGRPPVVDGRMNEIASDYLHSPNWTFSSVRVKR